MPRKPRIQYEGILHHVTARGMKGQTLFADPATRALYLEMLERYHSRYDFRLYAYSFGDNQVDLLIEQRLVPLAKIMQGLQQSFTQNYHKHHHTTGQVFGQRYQSHPYIKGDDLLPLIMMIHHGGQIPPSGVASKPLPDSSHTHYLAGDGTGLINVDDVLMGLSMSKDTAVKQYAEISQAPLDPAVIAAAYLTEETIAKLQAQQTNEALRTTAEEQISIDELIERVCSISGVAAKDLLSPSRKRIHANARRAVIILSDDETQANGTEIAKALGISLTLVSKIRHNALPTSAGLDDLLDKYQQTYH